MAEDFSKDRTAVRIWPLWEKGIPPHEIATLIGVTRQRVHQVSKKYGWIHPSKLPAHGTVKQYIRGCRCTECRKSNSARRLNLRRRKIAAGSIPGSVKHGVSAAVNWGCRCEVCTEAVRERNASDLKRRADLYGNASGVSPEQAQVRAAAERARNAGTKVSAARDGYQWTGPELEFACRDDLSISEIAKRLGRTYAAVSYKRYRCRTDPRMARLAGLDTPEARKADP